MSDPAAHAASSGGAQPPGARPSARIRSRRRSPSPSTSARHRPNSRRSTARFQRVRASRSRQAPGSSANTGESATAPSWHATASDSRQPTSLTQRQRDADQTHGRSGMVRAALGLGQHAVGGQRLLVDRQPVPPTAWQPTAHGALVQTTGRFVEVGGEGGTVSRRVPSRARPPPPEPPPERPTASSPPREGVLEVAPPFTPPFQRRPSGSGTEHRHGPTPRSPGGPSGGASRRVRASRPKSLEDAPGARRLHKRTTS